MGCDIHAFVEIKHEGTWHLLGEVCIDRSYELFERMAGVRGDVDLALVPPKGFPGDMAVVTRIERARWGRDAHTPSWFNAEEMQKIDEWVRSNRPGDRGLFVRSWDSTLYLFGNYICDWWLMPDERPDGVEDIRLVFWFDN